MTNNIDIKKIMAEVEVEVARRRVSNKYKKDLKLLEEFGKVETKDNNLYDLKMQSYHTKTVQLPHSLKKGIFSKLSNQFILKIYFVVGKMFENSLRTQQKINTKLIDEVIEVKKKLNLVDLDHFPYAEFKKTFFVKQGIYDATYSTVKDHITEAARILELNAANAKFLSQILQHKPKDLVALNKHVEEISQVEIPEAVVLEHREVFEYLSNSSVGEFDLTIMQDLAEYMSLNYLITVLKEINRTLVKGGKLIIRTLDPRKDNVLKNTFDPKMQKPIHPEMLKFLLDYYNFDNITILDDVAGLEDYYVAVCQKK